MIKPVNWPSTTPTTDNKGRSAREGRRLKFSVISICSTRKDVSMVIVAKGIFKQKTRIKIPCK